MLYLKKKKKMFVKIDDPRKRDALIQEVLKRRRNIQLSNLAERVGDIETYQDLTKDFKPLLDSHKELTTNIINQLEPIKEGIKELPKLTQIHPEPSITHTLAVPSVTDFHSVPNSDDEYEDAKTSTVEPTAHKYLTMFANREGNVDKSTGLHTDKHTGEFKIGDTPVDISENNIIIGGKEYEGTPGLWELIVSNKPRDYTGSDHSNYEEIMRMTHALHQNNDPNNPHPKASKSQKWKEIGKPIWNRLKDKRGSGIPRTYITIPKNPNALIERYDKLRASKGAGNTGVDNELVSICDELCRQSVITKDQYKKLLP